MPKSTRSFLFPDINVWIALTYRRHVHYAPAKVWFDSLPDTVDLCFCRVTQLGFLRLLTNATVFGNQVCSQVEAWKTYDDWIENGPALFLEEPSSLEQVFRNLSRSQQAAPNTWADSYIAAFAQATGVRLVTFDRALSRRSEGSLLLPS